MNSYILPLNTIEFSESDMTLIKYVSPEKKDFISRCKINSTKKLSLYSELLVKMVIAHKLGIAIDSISFRKNEYGKPYIDKSYNFFFNYSHTDNAILLSTSTNGEIGCDIEHLRPFTKRLVSKIFSANELAKYNTLSDAEKSSYFFEVWTKKEAYTKFLGTGLNNNLNLIDTCDSEINHFLYSSHFDEYTFSICSKGSDKSNILFLNEEEIIRFFN